MDEMLSLLIPKLRERLESIEKRHHSLTYLIENRSSNERLLHLEVMHAISNLPGVSDYLPEKRYNVSSSEKCDFWFRYNDTEYGLK